MERPLVVQSVWDQGLADQEVHRAYMRLALAEGHRALGRVSPNPAVGAVLVRDGRVV